MTQLHLQSSLDTVLLPSPLLEDGFFAAILCPMVLRSGEKCTLLPGCPSWEPRGCPEKGLEHDFQAAGDFADCVFSLPAM